MTLKTGVIILKIPAHGSSNSCCNTAIKISQSACSARLSGPDQNKYEGCPGTTQNEKSLESYKWYQSFKYLNKLHESCVDVVVSLFMTSLCSSEKLIIQNIIYNTVEPLKTCIFEDLAMIVVKMNSTLTSSHVQIASPNVRLLDSLRFYHFIYILSVKYTAKLLLISFHLRCLIKQYRHGSHWRFSKIFLMTSRKLE